MEENEGWAVVGIRLEDGSWKKEDGRIKFQKIIAAGNKVKPG